MYLVAWGCANSLKLYSVTFVHLAVKKKRFYVQVIMLKAEI